jgi:hypothetical protein
MSIAILVGTAKGAAILRSDESRRVWSTEALALAGWKVTAAARDARGRYYVAIAADTYGAAIMVSDDLRSFRQLPSAPRYAPGDRGNADHTRLIGASLPFGAPAGEQRRLDQIWALHAAPDALYAGVSEAGLFVSRDRGESWAAVTGLNEHATRAEWEPGFGGLCLHSILQDGRDPRRLWVGISAAGVLRSDDGGETWDLKNDGVSQDAGCCVHAIAHDPARADLIYRQDHRGMYRSDNGGDSWRLIENGLPRVRLSDEHECAFGFPIAFDPASNCAFAIPLEGDNFRYPPGGALRVYRTRDGGAVWAPAGEGLPRAHYASILRAALAIDHRDPCGIYFGATAGGLYASVDGGEQWTTLAVNLPRILCVKAFAQ